MDNALGTPLRGHVKRRFAVLIFQRGKSARIDQCDDGVKTGGVNSFEQGTLAIWIGRLDQFFHVFLRGSLSFLFKNLTQQITHLHKLLRHSYITGAGENPRAFIGIMLEHTFGHWQRESTADGVIQRRQTKVTVTHARVNVQLG